LSANLSSGTFSQAETSPNALSVGIISSAEIHIANNCFAFSLIPVSSNGVLDAN